ncbi:MAG: glutamyl-tRNA amidotransferase [Peptococcaceae bacterium BICA1-7]|nr:MAG: glutamyl-tRNA amidotransferase [Peptococcaceae bacterium BICA1-7]HBV96658.1 Asp-tRNA(Asn)/Glu-tRNA(Gln) amidotransferase subunit GatA [Desulfotomaculum sp.]
MDLFYMTAHELHAKLAAGEISARELCRAFLDRIVSVEDRLKAFITVTEEMALKQADEVDKRIAAGEELPPLAGIPIALKDNMCVEGIRTTCASKILFNFVPPYSATVVEKIKSAGMVIIGKTNMDEFAMGSSTENSGFQPTSNPWDTERVPGGSSGGSAVSVAAGETVLALGSDTGGSIRQPASLCGVVGMKPTYGAVSRYGLVAFASSLDQIGPFARDVDDCAQLLNIITGHDPLDSTSAPGEKTDYTAFLNSDIKGLKVGVPREYMGEGIDPGVRAVIEKALQVLSSLGADIEEATLPHSRYAIPVYYLIATAEASSNLARYDGVKYGLRDEEAQDIVDMYMKSRSRGFGTEVKRRIMLGTYALSAGYYDAYYLKALKARTLIKQDFDRAFDRFDVLVCPTSPGTAFRKGEKTDDPLQMYLSDITTISVNLAGIPGISVPAGFSGGLPVGMQIMGRPFAEGNLIRVAHAFEGSAGHRGKFPSLI